MTVFQYRTNFTFHFTCRCFCHLLSTFHAPKCVDDRKLYISIHCVQVAFIFSCHYQDKRWAVFFSSFHTFAWLLQSSKPCSGTGKVCLQLAYFVANAKPSMLSSSNIINVFDKFLVKLKLIQCFENCVDPTLNVRHL